MSLLKNKVCNTNKCCGMLVWEIEILNGKKKKSLGIFTQTCFEFVDGFAWVFFFFSKREITVISCQFTATLKTIIIGYCS